jgi:predicted DNA-binding mobile mystery protein A
LIASSKNPREFRPVLLPVEAGMTLDAFGKRLGVTRATAHQIERAEANESITLKRLRAAADALGCDVLVQIVPRQSLDSMITERAYEVARTEFAWLNHTMVLENQAIYDADQAEFIAEIAQDLIERRDSRLWTSK